MDVLGLLESVADYDQTVEQAREELVSEGVDVSAFLSRVQQAVSQQKKDERLAWKREAQSNTEAFLEAQDIEAYFAGMDTAMLREAAGRYANDVHFKDLETQTDEDLRTLLVDRARLERLAKK